MAAAKKTATRAPARSATKGASATAPDAVKLLTSDHKEVKQLFQEYRKLVDSEAGDDQKQAVAQEICSKLTVHATVEEEIFYPAAEEAFDEPDLVDEAAVEHATAKDLIAQIEAMSPSDDRYDAKVKVLGEYIDHHVQEEEGEMFPKAKKSGMDLQALGGEMAARKEELLAEMGVAEAR